MQNKVGNSDFRGNIVWANFFLPEFLHNQWDELGAEAADHAKIWHLYNDESSRLDAVTLDGCNRGIDVLLVFVRVQALRGL